MKAVAAVVLSAATLVVAVPPGIPSESQARSLLSSLSVSTQPDDGNYDRDLFRHWQPIEGSCNAREYVLRRDGDNVEVGNDCYPTSGTWTSLFDGEVHDQPSDVSIDHMVPLKNAWISGASSWSASKREEFANDVEGPQLWAVGARINSEKSDKNPAEWQPPLEDIHCDYAGAWIQVKSDYDLTITSAEKEALEDMLAFC